MRTVSIRLGAFAALAACLILPAAAQTLDPGQQLFRATLQGDGGDQHHPVVRRLHPGWRRRWRRI